LKLVFTLTAGRTGTMFLARLLQANLPEGIVHHEILSYDAFGKHTPEVSTLHSFNNSGNTETVQAFWAQKFRRILAANTPLYAETSHVLMKAGLVENATAMLPGHELHFVVLKRPMAPVIRSYLRRGDFANIGNQWLWYLDPHYQRNLIDKTEFIKRGLDGVRMWYLCEIAARAAYYKERYADLPNVHFHEVDLATLNTPDGAAELLRKLTPSVEEVTIPEPANTSRGPAIPAAVTERVDRLVAEIADYDPTASARAWMASGIDPFAPVQATHQPISNPGVFIGGAGRSGTTLLVDLLGLHPSLSPVYETDFLPAMLRRFLGAGSGEEKLRDAAAILQQWTEPLPHRPHTKAKHERFVHGPHYVLLERDPMRASGARMLQQLANGGELSMFRDWVREVFQCHADADGKPRWINKTPQNLLVGKQLLQLFPESRFLLCVRDPRATIASAMRRPWGPRTVEQGVSWWTQQAQLGLNLQAEFPDRVLTVRYEDVLSDPRTTLERILRFSGEAGAEKIIRAHQAAGMTLQAERRSAWEQQFSESEKDQLDRALATWLERYGYPREAVASY